MIKYFTLIIILAACTVVPPVGDNPEFNSPESPSPEASSPQGEPDFSGSLGDDNGFKNNFVTRYFLTYDNLQHIFV